MADGAASEEAVSLAAAAERLGVKPQRINQLLQSGKLAGPDYGEGRAPKGVGRVWISSLESELARRRPARSDLDQAAEVPREGLRESADDGNRLVAREAAARAAAQRMKVAADAARAELRQERTRGQRLTAVLKEVVALLATAHGEVDQADEITDAYAEALTQLLGPFDVEDLESDGASR